MISYLFFKKVYLNKMNFLAHIYLSGDDTQLALGNFIADAVKGKKYLEYPDRIRDGIILHRKIDSFTDSHPIVKQSVSRLFPTYKHYSTVIVDILYDHYLAANWLKYHSTPLAKFTDEFYTVLNNNYDLLPKRIQKFLPIMIHDNWILSYKSIPGIGNILYQMNIRTKNKSRMDLAVKELNLYYDEFGKEFEMFFKELEDYVKTEISNL